MEKLLRNKGGKDIKMGREKGTEERDVVTLLT
jgi:hypothetical protein